MENSRSTIPFPDQWARLNTAPAYHRGYSWTTETDVRFEVKKHYSPKELEQHEVLAAKIKRIVAEARAKEREVREATARLAALPTDPAI